MAEKMPKVVAIEPVMEQVTVEAGTIDIPPQNDSSDGLARMYADLAPAAHRLRSTATWLLLISVFFCGSIEGLFGVIAAASVLCCAAPGSLGTAYAARCTRIAAVLCAAFALGNFFCLGTMSIMMPHMPEAVSKACANVPESVVAEQPAVVETPVAAPAELPPTFEMSFEAISIPASASEGAHTFVAIAVAGARRLQAVVPEHLTSPQEVQCMRAEYFVDNVLPYLLFMGMIGELCLFTVAMKTARRALELVLLARRSGANAL